MRARGGWPNPRSAGPGNESFERARITAWEPGARLAWESHLDDVRTEVSFLSVPGGTRVVVEHFIPEDGQDNGGTAWSRVVPGWFGSWCAKRHRVPHEQIDIARLSLGVHYARPAAAARWLARVFGFESLDELPTGTDPLPHDKYRPPWIEFRLGNSLLNVFTLDGERAADRRPTFPGCTSMISWRTSPTPSARVR